jgi:3-phosphoshikimate 1-carboxyvinyltransferase
MRIGRAAAIVGKWRPPGDKSLTHRAYMFASIASGESVVRMPLRGEDCEATRDCLVHLGMRHEWLSSTEIRLIPSREWVQPGVSLDCGNSGTTMRLLSGLLASRPLLTTLSGDESLSKRPMGRIKTPLKMMGAKIEGDRAPIVIHGGELLGIDYESPVASAQVKSAILLAGLRASGTTRVTEPALSRDHTERMLSALGIELLQMGNTIQLKGGQTPTGFEFDVPADISSAAFFMVAAAILSGSRLEISDLSVNPSRIGILDVFTQCGIPWGMFDEQIRLNEPVASVAIETSVELKPFVIEGALVPRLIDEIPILAVLATQCEGTSFIRDAKELRVKESDRIETVAAALRAMGAIVETFEDGMAITGPTRLKAAKIEAFGDHRIAMAFAIAGLVADGTTEINGAESILTSFPSFETDLERLLIL